jgi:hypothetical protein
VLKITHKKMGRERSIKMNVLNNKVMKLAILAGAFLSISTVEAARTKKRQIALARARQAKLLERELSTDELAGLSDSDVKIYRAPRVGAFMVVKKEAAHAPSSSLVTPKLAHQNRYAPMTYLTDPTTE